MTNITGGFLRFFPVPKFYETAIQFIVGTKIDLQGEENKREYIKNF